MESVIDDPELAMEMVKLLGQELKQLRAQLREVSTWHCIDSPPFSNLPACSAIVLHPRALHYPLSRIVRILLKQR